jgi:hypothetical protein
MWISGEQAGHHTESPYEPDGCEELRTELLKDFVQAPAADAFRASGPIQTIRDLNVAMVNIGQKPVPSTSAMLAALLPSDEVATVSRGRLRAAIFHESSNHGRQARKRRSTSSKPAANKKIADRKSINVR